MLPDKKSTSVSYIPAPLVVSSPKPPSSLKHKGDVNHHTDLQTTRSSTHSPSLPHPSTLVFSDGRKPLSANRIAPTNNSTQLTSLQRRGTSNPFQAFTSHPASTVAPTLDATALIFGRSGPRAYDPHNDRDPYAPANWQIPWDQREMFKKRKNDFDSGSYSAEMMCNFCLQPKFWRKIDWAFRFAVFVILPTAALALNPRLIQRRVFLSASVIIDTAYTGFQENIGLGIQGVLNDAQGYALSFLIALSTIAIDPTEGWQFILVQAVQVFFINILFPDVMSSASSSLANLTAQLLRSDVESNVSYKYISNFYACFAIGMGMALPAYFIPRPIIALRRAELYCGIAGNSISVVAKGIMSSFWCSPLQRQLNLVSLRALQQTATAAILMTDTAMKDAMNEPHKGLTLLRMQQRCELLKAVSVILHGGLSIIEQIATTVSERTEAAEKFAEPERSSSDDESGSDTSEDGGLNQDMFLNNVPKQDQKKQKKSNVDDISPSSSISVEKNGFTDEAKLMGKALEKPLVRISVATDTFMLKIVDFTRTLKESDYQSFAASVEKFEHAVNKVRRKYVSENVQFSPDNFNIQIGFFLFVLHELCHRIKSFREPTEAPSNFKAWAHGPLNVVKRSWNNLVYLVGSLAKGRLPRKAKEGIKLSISMMISLTYEIYSGSPSPISGSALIPGIYRKMGADTFYFSTLRVLGTVFGSTTSFALVRILIEPTVSADDGYYWILGLLPFMCFIGAFVIRSPPVSAAGKAWVSSCISILSRYNNPQVAIQRITNNVFAIVTYFLVSTFVWPVRATNRITLELDSALRSLRDSSSGLLKGFAAKDFEAVTSDVTKATAKFNKHTVNVGALITGASREPNVTGGSTFPVEQWKQIAITLRDIAAILALTRFAYLKFRSSSAKKEAERLAKKSSFSSGGSPTDLNETDLFYAATVNQNIITHLSKVIGTVGELISAALDLQLLLAGDITEVPVTHLVRIRIHLLNTVALVEEKFCDVLGRNVKNLQEKKRQQKQYRRESLTTASLSRQVSPFMPIETDAHHVQSAASASQISRPTIVIQPPSTSQRAISSQEARHTSVSIKSPGSWISSEGEHTDDEDFAEIPVMNGDGAGGQMGLEDAMLGTRGRFPTEADFKTAELQRRAALKDSNVADIHSTHNTALPPTVGLQSLDAFMLQPIELDASDIHSLEAFLFGIRGLVNAIWALEKGILELKHITKIYEKV